jgi:hypothetical protein
MGEPTAARIDRAALERIIQRAAELQTAERDIGESLTPDEVLALGREVGIPARYLQQALLEERTRPPDQPVAGVWDRLAGPSVVSTQRVVRGRPEDIERSLVRWIEQNELLCIQRQQPGRITWEPLGGFQAAIRRSTAALGAGKRPFMLSKARTVSATLTPLDADYCHVSLAADLAPIRGAHLTSAVGLAASGAGMTILLLTMSAILPVALFPLPLGFGLSWATLRRYRPVPARVLLGLERALDQLERGVVKPSHQLPEARPGLLELIADEVRRSLRT